MVGVHILARQKVLERSYGSLTTYFSEYALTYDLISHLIRVWKTGLPVRSAVLKPHAGELVVGWVTTSESSLLYVILFFFFTLCCFC
ncbi:L-lysine 2-3-aminomutase [Penicillium crustosum]|uniref:L-lysine 2-3-aminomutase n=1 Tax=Penicillium crustosum TaxID=36656 RepID=UPI002398B555|nr:L-lysine 2-3-aminomutase [Penicillium crustosum]KAJ5395293.1 L-lysine 2-3-aminomutase [Penicillium crustosum]